MSPYFMVYERPFQKKKYKSLIAPEQIELHLMHTVYKSKPLRPKFSIPGAVAVQVLIYGCGWK